MAVYKAMQVAIVQATTVNTLRIFIGVIYSILIVIFVLTIGEYGNIISCIENSKCLKKTNFKDYILLKVANTGELTVSYYIIAIQNNKLYN